MASSFTYHQSASKKEFSQKKTLSQALSSIPNFNGDYLNASSHQLDEITTIPLNYTKITKINLSHNNLQTLDGINQFKNLTHINVSHNYIQSFTEFLKIKNPDNLLVLNIQENPISLHPNILPLLLSIFPHLIELNNIKIHDFIKQDILDSILLSKTLMKYLYRNEKLIMSLDIDIKRLKIKYELFNALKNKINPITGPYWEDINAAHNKELKKLEGFPKLPKYNYNKIIRPYMIINYIETASKALQKNDDSNSFDQDELFRIYKWLFCEILILMENSGKNDLQTFLEKSAKETNINIDDQERLFETELLQFYQLGVVLDNAYTSKLNLNSARIDVYPFPPENSINFLNNPSSRYLKAQNLTRFPIFGCNQDYLRIILTIIKNQIDTIEILYNEKEQLLRFDASQLGLPGFSDPRIAGYSLKKDRSNKEITEETRCSPIHCFGTSPEPISLRIPVSPTQGIKSVDFDLGSDKAFLHEIEEEISSYEREYYGESRKSPQEFTFKTQKHPKDIKKLFEFYQNKINRKKSQKMMRNILNAWKRYRKINRKKQENIEKADSFYKDLQKSRYLLSWRKNCKINNLHKRSLLNKAFKGLHEACILNPKYHNSLAERHYTKKLLKKPFISLLYHTLKRKANMERAGSFYSGKLKLNSFFMLKSYAKKKRRQRIDSLASSITENKPLMAHIIKDWEESHSSKRKKDKEKAKEEINKLLKRINKSEKSIEKLWNLMKTTNKNCRCGGFKCEVCISEKAQKISEELDYLLQNIKTQKIRALMK
ncbi:unnamed protein product [Blepharisma stoltei]|uniref:Leucine-rich repeat protein n=1 Tax=Blepharisma stoltei TaxID=1481888 RepID=A0AAU9JAH4_9CILI|nr:unnamed protein product [Blepharisma stoltei]